jgi:hypothetical protein
MSTETERTCRFAPGASIATYAPEIEGEVDPVESGTDASLSAAVTYSVNWALILFSWEEWAESGRKVAMRPPAKRTTATAAKMRDRRLTLHSSSR